MMTNWWEKCGRQQKMVGRWYNWVTFWTLMMMVMIMTMLPMVMVIMMMMMMMMRTWWGDGIIG